jgi:predicted nucleic acid-binding Zn ribbon protein
MVRKVKNVQGVTFCSESCATMMDKEQLKSHLMVRFAYHYFVEHVHPIMMNSTNVMASHS